MDWYYPVLGGPVRGEAGLARLSAGWDDFVVPGLGARCVRDQPWVTGAETCELVLALDALGDRSRAAELFADIQHLRDPAGGYWTGWQYVNQAHFPAEQSSWTAAAIILAADALSGATGAAGIFRDAGGRWPAAVTADAKAPHPGGADAGGADAEGAGAGAEGAGADAAGAAACGCSADAFSGPLEHP